MKSPYISVSLAEASDTIRKLLSQGLLNKSLKMKKYGDVIKIPLLESPYAEGHSSGVENFEERYAIRSPYTVALDHLRSLGIDEKPPENWIKLGNSAFIRIREGEHLEQIAEAVALATNSRSVYMISGRISGKERIPSVKLLYGPGGEITHRENGIRYRFDPLKIMYSPGNVNERISASRMNVSGKVVWDMFSGIGYFSLPILKYGNPELVYCTDINTVAIRYLRINAELNHVGARLREFVTDCSLFVPEVNPDLIVMGNFDAIRYLPVAEHYINRGGKIILHHLMDHGTEKSIKAAAAIISNRIERRFSVDMHRVVKSYSPKKWHVVTELTVF